MFLRLAEQAEPELLGAQQHAWLNHLDVEHANLRAALDYLIGAVDEARALRLTVALHRFWEFRGYVSEGRNWLQAALAIRGTSPIAYQAAALNAAGALAFRQGELAQARLLHEEAFGLFQQAEEEIGIADTLNYLAVIDMEQGEYESARLRVEEALALHHAMKHELGVANSLSRLGTLAWDEDRFTDARDYRRRSLEIYQRLNMPLTIASTLLAVGDTERMLDNWASARADYEECGKIARNLGHRGLVAASLKSMGLLAYAQGDFEQAQSYGEEALHIFCELGDRVHTAFTLSHLGHVAWKFGDCRRALSYFGQFLQIMFDVGYKWPTFYALEDIVELLTEVEQHSEAAARFLGAADALRRQTGLAVASNFLAKYERMTTALRQQLGDERFAALRQQGEGTPLPPIIAEVTSLILS